MLSKTGDEIVEYFAFLLKVPRERISPSANVLELGADSIMLMEARTWIEGRFGRRIEIRRFFEDLTTIEALAAFLADAPAAATTAAAADAASPLPSSPSAIASADIRLMRAQLALVAEVIEAQNRLAGGARGLVAGSPRDAEVRGDRTAGDRSAASAAPTEAEVAAA